MISSQISSIYYLWFTHWGRVTHICVSNLAIICSDNRLSPDRRQAIIWPNAGIFLIEPLGTNFSEILIEIRTFSFKKMQLKMSSGKYRPLCVGLYASIFLWTQWGIDNMGDSFQTTSSWKNNHLYIWFELHRNLFLRVQFIELDCQ